MSNHSTRHLLTLLLTIALLLAASTEPAGAGKLNLSLQKKLVESPQVSMTALVFLTPDVDNKISLSNSLSSIQSFKVRYQTAFTNLKTASRRSYEAFVREAADSNLGLEIGRRFWIANAVEVTGTPTGFARLAELESVQIIVEDTVLQLVDPVEVMESPTAPTAVEENLIAINADDLWQMGYTGEGRLVMSFDTGVDGGHEGLASRWRGLTSGNPAEGWYDPFSTTFPGDGAGHGTHVMGLMAGHLNGDTVGVAPDAEWACAAVVDRGVGFSQTISNILLAFEWAANPDGDPETVHDIPDAVCHSWGIPRGVFDACDNTFWQAIDNLEQLGIVNVFACGNEGPDPMTIRNPADRASSPLNSFSVGAVDHTVDGYPVASFSSRGPANCDTTAIKPEVVAPGVALRSFAPGGGMKTMSGTSMAAPQVAGAVALLRQYNPDATVGQIKHALLMSARDIGDEGEDNESGHGLIDLANAINYMPSPQQTEISIKRFDILDDGNGIIQPDETVQLAISIEPVGLDVDGLYGIISTYDPDITILSDSVSYGDVIAGQEYSGTGVPFEVSASRYVTPGISVAFIVDFYDEYGSFISTAGFDVVVAQSQYAASSSIDNGVTAIGGCNYGVVGLGEGSLVDMGQAGFSVDSVSYLSEFALVIADSDGRVSDAARDETGDASDNDFVADVAPSFSVSPPDSWGDLEMAGQFTDDLAENPIGVGVDERVTLFYEEDLNTTAFVRFLIRNRNQSGSRTLSLGILADIDLPGPDKGAEMISYNSEQNLAFYYDSDLSCYVGTAILSDPVESWVHYSNSFDSKTGLSDSVKASAMNSGAIAAQPSKRADYLHLMSIAPQTIDAGQVLEMAVAIVWAETEAELIVKCDKARDAYLTPTAAGDDDIDPLRPESFTLSQNYPNPFNPQTTIQFSVERTDEVSLRIYNLLGQEVTTLIDQAVDVGSHEVIWDGTNHSGDRVASGIYFYRLDTSTGSITRKMMLLK